jgi:hypothetical protein
MLRINFNWRIREYMKHITHITFAVITIIIITGGCSTYRNKTENTSLQNAVYILESVKDLPTGRVFSFRDYCVFNAERGGPDSDLDRTLAEANARLELHFFDGMAELRLESSNGSKNPAFLEYQKHYASRFSFIENVIENVDKNIAGNGNFIEIIEFTLTLDTLDAESRTAIEAMSDLERDAVLKSVFEKSEDIFIEPDEDDNVVNYWRRIR